MIRPRKPPAEPEGRPCRSRWVWTAALLLLSLPGSAGAVPDALPGHEWQTVRVAPFVIHFHEAGRPWAERALAAGQDAWAQLEAWTGRRPAGPVHVVILPDGDETNALATPLPRNTIRIYPLEPRPPSLLAEYSDWIALLMIHELTHIFHLDWSEPPAAWLRYLFGRTGVAGVRVSAGGQPLTLPVWMLLPNAYLSDLLVEGYAVWAESLHGGIGRANGGMALSLLRNLSRDGAIPGLGGATGLRRAWPGGMTGYQLGGAFHAWAAGRFDDDVWLEAYRRNARGWTPWLFSVPWARTTGEAGLASWADFVEDESRRTVAFDMARGALREGAPMAGPWQGLSTPRFGPDGQLWATVRTGRQTPQIGRIRRDGEFQAVVERFGGGSLAVGPDERLLYDARAWLDDQVPVSRLVVWRDGRRTTLPMASAVFEPDRRGDRLVWVEREGASQCLRLQEPGRELRWCAPPHEPLSRPRIGPDGSVLFARWQAPGRHDIWRWTPGADPVALAPGPVEAWLPGWGPDGSVLAVRIADGLPELHRLEDGRWRPLTRSRTGVWDWAVDDAGTRLVYTAPGGAGWFLYEGAWADFSSALPVATRSAEPRWPTSVPVSAPVRMPLPEAAPYRPLPTLWPTRWLPGASLGGERPWVGFGTGGQDVLWTWAWQLDAIWDLRGGGIVEGAVARDRGARSSIVDGGFWMRPAFGDLSADRRWQVQFREQRRWRSVESTVTLAGGVALEGVAGGQAVRLAPNLVAAWDGRRATTWSIGPGEGGFVRALMAGDAPPGQVTDSADARLEWVGGFHGYLLGRSQWRLAAAAAAHLRSDGPLDYTLWSVGSGSFGPRSYVARGSSRSIGGVDRFALADATLLLPLWWPQSALGFLPLHLDHVDLRPWLAVAAWQRGPWGRTDGAADAWDAAAGAELVSDWVFGHRSGFSLGLGVQAGLHRDRGAWTVVLNLGTSFDQAGWRVAPLSP